MSTEEYRPKAGDIIDGFAIGNCIAAGGAAYLYECSHPDHPVPLLMKIPRLGPNQPVAGLISFETECMIQPRLATPHAPRVFGVGRLDDTPYLVMEAIDGPTLDNKIATRGTPPLEDLIEIGAAIARALHAIHRSQVIHLDVKPANMILTRDFRIVLLDFGFAHHAQCPDLFFEAAMKGVGTPAYISPEQILGLRHDPRSDQFSLGVVLYEMATGKLPFGDMQADSEMGQRLWRAPVPLRHWRPELPPWFQEVVMRCLEALPEDRFPSCAQIAWLLSQPQKIELTPERQHVEPAGVLRQAKRWWRSRDRSRRPTLTTASNPLDQAPVVLVALDPESDDLPLLEALRTASRRIMRGSPESRLTCLSVITGGGVQESAEDNEADRQHHALIALKHWAASLSIEEQRLSLHVFEESNPGQRILSFAAHNQVDMIILGASHAHGRFEFWRSVMAEVVEKSHCSVLVVRPHTD